MIAGQLVSGNGFRRVLYADSYQVFCPGLIPVVRSGRRLTMLSSIIRISSAYCLIVVAVTR